MAFIDFEDIESFEAWQRGVRDSEREEALETIRQGKVYAYCPSVPGEPRRVFLITTIEDIEEIWGQ